MSTTIFSSGQPPMLPGLRIDDSAKSPRTLSSVPPPQSPKAQVQATGSSTSQAPDSQKQYRILSQAEWEQFCRGVGVFKDVESKEVIRSTCWYWPPKGFLDGLYQDVLFEKTKFTYWFHLLSTGRWVLMLLQLALNAVLTALGALSSQNGTPITIIAAINTSIAGVLALMHNSGLPDRYRSDRNEFYKVEEYLKEIIDTRLVDSDQDVSEAMAECFSKFSDARQTVQNNIPASYTPTTVASPPASRGSRVIQKVEAKK